MVVITQQNVSLRKRGVDPADLEAVYFHWMGVGSATSFAADRARRTLRLHRELAAERRPGSATALVYPHGHHSGLGPAIQIVNDDMPLLVDSVSSMLRRLGAPVSEIVHPVFDVLRDNHGRLRAIAAANPEPPTVESHTIAESWIHVQLADEVGDDILEVIERSLPPLLAAIRRISVDATIMTSIMRTAASDLETESAGAGGDTADFAHLLRWLVNGGFTPLGYCYLPGDDQISTPEPRDGLGLLHGQLGADLDVPHPTRERQVVRVLNGSLDSVLPGAPGAYFVSVTDFGGATTTLEGAVGQPRGDHVFLGTLTVTGQHESILDIPVIAHRVRQVIDWAGFAPDSYSARALLEMLQTFPRAELFATDARRLFDTVSAVMDLGLKRQVRLFLRPDTHNGALYCLVCLPRDRYTTEARRRMQEILRSEFHGEQISYSARVTESDIAVLHFTVHRGPDAPAVAVTDSLRERVQESLFTVTRTWGDLLVAEAATQSEVSAETAREYAAVYPAGYQQEHTPAQALADLVRLERLGEGAVEANLYRNPTAPEREWRFMLYSRGEGVSLSRMLPILHSLGVEVVDERPYRLELPDGSTRWIYDFGLRMAGAAAPVVPGRASDNSIRLRFAGAVLAMWSGRAEIDGLNELVVRAGLHWRQISVLRAYAKYLRQTGFGYTFDTITRVLLGHPGTARAYIDLFEAFFYDAPGRAVDPSVIEDRLQATIDAEMSLDADRILRAFLGLITATLRTNYYVLDEQGRPRDHLSFKLDPHRIAELPKPRPQFEIFVYSPRVEGVHLRFGPVARGGLRWSDRLEDFRTEILGLVKAQAVKNAVIVPVGAKGGFVVKRPPVSTADPAADRQALQNEGVACYRTFIAGLLDITDNVDRSTGEVIPPQRVRRRDGDDTYLVVAADKGTATFSDVANDVAAQYGFWLGNAFASGGSVGYDHKVMGITARGAWESVKRHFAEMDIDTQTTDFTVVGVGDMSGDVFGNGMLLSRHIRLVAAFDHRHIFLDPNPDAATSYVERERLFALPRSSWADYDRSLISAGGGVFDRTVKSVPISAEIGSALGLAPGVRAMSPPELMRSILKAPAQLLWNGGIGTYVKAESETHADVGDKSNDAVRVSATELRVNVIGEGGNLGVTPLGRIEFCLAGGKMNTDALDNSAGVDCSDHEVNIKILLDGVVADGELSAGGRDRLLASMTGEVGELVLRNNVSQNARLGISRAHAASMAAVHRRMLSDLEDRHGLDRVLEALPSDAEMKRRIAAGSGLTSPELATLLAHVKLSLKHDLLAGDVLDGPAFTALLPDYFPAPLRDRFGPALQRHPLRRQIIATTVVNRMVDYGGTSYVFRLVEEMGVTVEDAVRAFTVVTKTFGLFELWDRIRATPMPTRVRDELELETKRTLDRASRWFLVNRPQPIAVGAEIARYRDRMRALRALVPAWQPGDIADDLVARSQRAIAAGAPADLAEEVCLLIHRFSLLDVIDVADLAQRAQSEVVALYFALDQHFGIQRLLDAVGGLDRGDRWRTLARLAVRDDLYDSLRVLTLDVLNTTGVEDDPVSKISYWESINRARVARARSALSAVFREEALDIATLSVAARQVRGMVNGGELGSPATGPSRI
ncbi:NAD-glutamate dehydrogenase [Nocardia sp. NPDC003693]